MIQIRKLRAAFPELAKDFIELLIERAIANGFTDEMLKMSFKNAIDKIKYSTPTIAEILSIEKFSTKSDTINCR